MTNGEVLLADDDPTLREELARDLRRLGYDVLTAPAALRSAQLARTCRFKYAVIDVHSSRRRGLDLVSELRRVLIDVRIVALVGQGKVDTAVEAMARGAHFYLTRPIAADDLSNALTGARRKHPGGGETQTMARVEWEHLQRILAGCGGNVSETARRLGITRRTVQLKLKQGPPV
jgi:two-component system, response regulator RegA